MLNQVSSGDAAVTLRILPGGAARATATFTAKGYDQDKDYSGADSGVVTKRHLFAALAAKPEPLKPGTYHLRFGRLPVLFADPAPGTMTEPVITVE